MNILYNSKTAREYSNEGRIEDWVHSFLCNEGNNIAFSDGLKLEKRQYIGPLNMPLHLFQRCCGPEENMIYKINEDGFLWRVSEIAKRRESGWDMPPLIINYSDNVFELNDGNHRYQAMINSGINKCDVIIWTTGIEDYQQFLEQYREFIYEISS